MIWLNDEFNQLICEPRRESTQTNSICEYNIFVKCWVDRNEISQLGNHWSKKRRLWPSDDLHDMIIV